MHLIITPSNGKLALIVDNVTGQIIREIDIPPQLNGEKNRPYGITKDAAGNWYISNWNRIGVFDSNFNFKFAINDLPENIHQIFWDEASEELWVCATSIDSLLAISLKAGFIRRFCLITNKWVDLGDPGSDTQHFSSVHWYGSHLYVLAHKKGVENSRLLTFDRSMTPTGIWAAGWECHSICRFNGNIFIVDSRGGRILGTNGSAISLGDKELYNGERNEEYENGEETSRKYARGMAINERGIAITSIFNFGKASTRDNCDVALSTFNISDKELLHQTEIKGIGNVQDIQLYHEDPLVIYGDMDKYKPVTDELNKLIKDILENKLLDNENDRMPYEPNRITPDMNNRFQTLINEPIDFAAQRNLKRLTKGIEEKAERILNSILPQTWKRSGGFWYPALNGYMDWHSNCEVPGPRLYFVWCAEANKSRFLFSEDGRTVSWKLEPAGWSINAFNIGNKSAPYWHAVDSGGTDRISFGFKTRG